MSREQSQKPSLMASARASQMVSFFQSLRRRETHKHLMKMNGPLWREAASPKPLS